jgi:hypothetical protein
MGDDLLEVVLVFVKRDMLAAASINARIIGAEEDDLGRSVINGKDAKNVR